MVEIALPWMGGGGGILFDAANVHFIVDVEVLVINQPKWKSC